MTSRLGGYSDPLGEVLLRVLVVRDLLDLVLWGETEPLRGVADAESGLRNARNIFRAAGFKAEP